MEQVKLKEFSGRGYLNEIFQSLDIKFAYVNKDKDGNFFQIHKEAKCRDFLGDVIWAKKTKNPVSIYGFRYAHAIGFEKNEDNTILSIKFPEFESLQNFKRRLCTLHTQEKKYGIEKTQLFSTDDKLTLLVVADKDYQSTVWKMSWFTYQLKLLSYKSAKEIKAPETNYKKYLTTTNVKALWTSVKNAFNEELSNELHMAHNHSGFVSIIKSNGAHTNYKEIFGGA